MTKPISEPKRANAKPGRVSLIKKEFEELIIDQGAKVRITPSLICPNITDLDSYNHDLNCTTCDNGIVDLSSKAVETWAFIQSVSQDKKMEQPGIFDMRDARASFLPDDLRINYWYKVEVLAFTSPYNQLIKRGATTTDKTRYIPQNDATVTKLYAIDKDGNEFEETTDFNIVGQGIEWVGASPAEGTVYSFSYPILPTYRVLELIHDSRFYYDDFKRVDKVPVHLPQQCVLRWDYLANQSGYEETNPNQPPPPTSAPPFKAGFGS